MPTNVSTNICANPACGNEFIPKKTSRVGRFCSLKCYHASGRPKRKEIIEHRMERVPDHPVAPPSGVAPIARMVLYDKIGPGVHPCHWCSNPVEWMIGVGLKKGALLVDHLNHDSTDDRPCNLVPSCDSCNKRRTRTGIFRPIIRDDELFIVAPNGSKHRAIVRKCEYAACGKEFLARLAFVKRGHGRFCSKDCMYQRTPS